MAAGLPGLSFNADYKAYFDPDDPFLKQLTAMEQRYETSDNVVVLLSTKLDTVLDPDVYRVIEAITDGAWRLPYIRRVQSIASLDLREGIDENIFFSDEDQDDEAIPDRNTLLQHPRVPELLMSKDARIAAINLIFKFPGQDTATELPKTAKDVRRLVEEELSTTPKDIQAKLTGTVMLADNYVNVVRHDLRVFIPCLMLMFFVSLTWFFRSPWLAALTLITALLALVMAFGIAGWMEFQLASIVAFAPVMITSLSIATSVHMITAYLRKTSQGIETEKAADYCLRFNWLAVSLTTITTTAGFLGLAFSPSPPVRTIGFIVAFGSISAMVLNLTLVPILLARKRSGMQRALLGRHYLLRLATLVNDARRPLIASMIAVTIVAVWLIPTNRIDDNIIEYFPPNNDFRIATELADRKLSGVTVIDYSLDTGRREGIFDADYLNTVSKFSTWLKRQELVARVSAVTDWVNLFEKTEVHHFTEDHVARYIRRLANRRPSELNIDHEITEDYSASRLRVFLNDSANRNVIQLDRIAKDWLERSASRYDLTGGAGPGLVFAHIGERNVKGMFYSLIIAVSVTALLIGLVTRSLYAIVICLVCNLIPIVWVFGAWTLLDGRLSFGAAVVVGMILGIIVDDSIHFIVKYFTFGRQKNRSKISPLEQVYTKVGPALVITTLVLSAGLAVGLLSDFRPVSVMCGLSVAIILVALIVDLTLLPAFLSKRVTQTTF